MLSPLDAALVRARFWQLQVPLTILSADQMGLHTVGDMGEPITFPDIDAVNFFLLGYRMGSESQDVTLPTEEAPPESEVAPEQEPPD